MEESENTLETLEIKTDKHWLWKKGVTQNKGGRPKGLAHFVRSQTKDGFEIVERMLQIMRGEMIVEKSFTKDGEEYSTKEEPSHRDRIVAAQWLADRGFGKVVETNINLDVGIETPQAVALALASLQNADNSEEQKAIES